MACLLIHARHMNKLVSERLYHSLRETIQSMQSMSNVPSTDKLLQLPKRAVVNIGAALISLYVMQVSHAAAQQGQVRDRPGGLLLEALIALPDLAGTLLLSNGWLYFPLYGLLSAQHHSLHDLYSLYWYRMCLVIVFMLYSNTDFDCCCMEHLHSLHGCGSK